MHIPIHLVLGTLSVLRLRLSGAIPLLQQYTFMTWKLSVVGGFGEAELWLQPWHGVPGPLAAPALYVVWL